MKTLKTVVNIIIVALIFALPAQAQSAKAVSKNDKEKIEFKTLNDFVKYQEAVEAGEIKPMDEAATPLPRDDTTPPVTKMYLVFMDFPVDPEI